MRALAIASLTLCCSALADEPFAWNVPSVRSRVEVPSTLRAQGIPVRLEQVISTEKLEPLIKHFAAVFNRAGLYLAPEREQRHIRGGFALTALDVKRLVSYTVMLRPRGDGSTEILLGEAHLGQKQKPSGAGVELAPVFPGATEVMTSDVEAARLVSYSIRASTTEVASFYRETLGKAGYHEAESSPGVFGKGSEELHVFIREERGLRRVTVVRQVRAADPIQSSPLE